MYTFYLHPPSGRVIRDDEQDARGLISPHQGDRVVNHQTLLEVCAFEDIGAPLRGVFWDWKIHSGVIDSAGRPGLELCKPNRDLILTAPRGLPDFLIGRAVPDEVKSDPRAHLLLKRLVMLAYTPATWPGHGGSSDLRMAHNFFFTDTLTTFDEVPARYVRMGQDIEAAIYMLSKRRRVRGPMLKIIHRFLNPELLEDGDTHWYTRADSRAQRICAQFEEELFPDRALSGD